MNLRLTFKLWIKYRKEHEKRVKDYEKKGILNYESSDDEKLKASPIRVKQKLLTKQDSVSKIAPSEWLSPRISKNTLSPNKRDSKFKNQKTISLGN